MQDKKTVSRWEVSPVAHSDLEKLTGKLLTIIETIGLPEKQESAIKSLVRNTLWNSWDNFTTRISIGSNGVSYSIREDGTIEATGGYSDGPAPTGEVERKD
jgi:hypothetical protein